MKIIRLIDYSFYHIWVTLLLSMQLSPNIFPVFHVFLSGFLHKYHFHINILIPVTFSAFMVLSIVNKK